MVLDLIFAVLGIYLLLVIVVPGVYNYMKSVRENVRGRDVRNAFFNTLCFGVVLVLSILLLKSIGVFKGLDTVTVYPH